jgi:hypothetical protein
MKTKKGKNSKKENSSSDDSDISTVSENADKNNKDPETFGNGVDKSTKTLNTKSKRSKSLEDGDIVLTREFFHIFIENYHILQLNDSNFSVIIALIISLKGFISEKNS